MSTKSTKFENIEVECQECRCTGTLRVLKERVVLAPSSPSPPHKYFSRKLGTIFNKHGGGTNRQWVAYMTTGSIFWLTVVLITNYLGLAKLTAHENFLSTTCNRNYKAFDDCRGSEIFIFPEDLTLAEGDEPRKEEIDRHNYTELEQITNRKRCKSYDFFDLKVCQGLCTIRGEGIAECKDICLQLVTSKTGMYGLICPHDELCPNGCPCPHYKCERISESSMLQVGWYYGHLNDYYFDPAPLSFVTGRHYEPSEISSLRVEESILALYDYRTGDHILFDKIQFGNSDNGYNPYTAFVFGNIDYVSDFEYQFGREESQTDKIHVIPDWGRQPDKEKKLKR